MNILQIGLGCAIAGIVALFTTSVVYIFLVSLLVFIVLVCILVLMVYGRYMSLTSLE